MLVLAIMLALAADLKVDHITIAASSLDAARKSLESQGIPTEYGGKHANGETEMALSSFPDGSYLEIIAPQPGRDASSHYWAKFMLNNAGPCAWAIRSADLAADESRLRASNVAVERQRNGRSRPDGVELKWETIKAGPGAPGSFFPFLIHDETPRARRVYPQSKPTTTRIAGVRYVVIAVENLDQAIAKYRAAFSLAAPTIEHTRAWFPGTPVILESGLADRQHKFGETPCAFILESQIEAHGPAERWFSRTVRWTDGSRQLGFISGGF